MKLSLFPPLIPIILFLIWGSSFFAKGQIMGQPLEGGQCDYKRYEGRAKIISMDKATDSPIRSSEKYEVKFIFTPDQEIKEPFAKTEGMEFLLLVGNTYRPSKRFLEKYGIEIDKVFDCYLKVIIRGTCTPVLFEFPSINLYDYDAN